MKNENSAASILIVDDVPDNISILTRFLKSHGFTVLVAYDGHDGLETASYAKPDLILLDIMMPHLNGFEVCKKLKEDKELCEIPVIFITALTETQEKVRAFEVGAVDYVTKPFQQREVLARLNTHLNLRRTQLQLQERNEELDAFAHTVSHDLKNPLSAIMSLSDSLLYGLHPERYPAETQIREIELVRQAGQQAVNIVDALLLLAGVSRQREVRFEHLEVLPIMQRVVRERLHMLIQRYQAEIQLPQQFIPPVIGFAPWIEEILVNYISNALKYGGKPPSIQLDAEPLEHYVRFWVIDNGNGLSEEEQQQLFQPYKRLEPHKRVDGHGLGLSIVQRIANRLGGDVGVESQERVGSRFYFTMPLAESLN